MGSYNPASFHLLIEFELVPRIIAPRCMQGLLKHSMQLCLLPHTFSASALSCMKEMPGVYALVRSFGALELSWRGLCEETSI